MECRINVTAEDISFWEENQISPALSIDSMRDILRIFVNGQLIGIFFLSSYIYIYICPLVSIHLSLCVRASIYLCWGGGGGGGGGG